MIGLSLVRKKGYHCRHHYEKGLHRISHQHPCQCRKQRAQRNHIACCYQAWLAIKVKALSLGKTLYALVHDLLYEFLSAELRHPRIPALHSV